MELVILRRDRTALFINMPGSQTQAITLESAVFVSSASTCTQLSITYRHMKYAIWAAVSKATPDNVLIVRGLFLHDEFLSAVKERTEQKLSDWDYHRWRKVNKSLRWLIPLLLIYVSLFKRLTYIHTAFWYRHHFYNQFTRGGPERSLGWAGATVLMQIVQVWLPACDSLLLVFLLSLATFPVTTLSLKATRAAEKNK